MLLALQRRLEPSSLTAPDLLHCLHSQGYPVFMTAGNGMAAGAPAIVFQAIGSTGAGVGEELAFPFKEFS